VGFERTLFDQIHFFAEKFGEILLEAPRNPKIPGTSENSTRMSTSLPPCSTPSSHEPKMPMDPT